jgi:hypothetical protein
MLPSAALQDRPQGHLADNVLHFARVLRAAGLPVGTDRALLALKALRIAGIASQADLHATLEACLIDRGDHRSLFDQAFATFWRDPDLLAQIMRMLLPQADASAATVPVPAAANRRLAQALFKNDSRPVVEERPLPSRRLEIVAPLSWSDSERLRKVDFDTMTASEWNAARRIVAALATHLAQITTRRGVPDPRGRQIDLRRLLRNAARHGGNIAVLPRRRPRTRPTPVTVIVDISGSMSRYSRMFLHFMHALTNGVETAGHRVHSFVFSTRLTHVTRHLKARDPDVAIASVVNAVADWSGGTRIGDCLKEFNQRWARRVLGGGSTVLLVTDGLERADIELLAAQTERLAKSCRRLVWLNPLLRYDEFEPKARGIVAMLPHVHRFLPVHNIESLEQLARTLTANHSLESTPWN